SLAEHVLDGELELDRLDRLSDEDILAELTAVKGLGTWTAHMFLIFQLERPDVLAVGGPGVGPAGGRGHARGGGARAQEGLARRHEPWRPYRSVACRLLWRSLDNAPA